MSVTAPAQETHFKRVLGLPALVAFGLAYRTPVTANLVVGLFGLTARVDPPPMYTGEEEELEGA